MLTAWRIAPTSGALEEIPPDDLREALWIDLVEPSDAEIRRVEALLAAPLPERADLREIEPSSRIYRDVAGQHLTILAASGLKERRPVAHPFGFILTPGDRLITLRFFNSFPVGPDTLAKTGLQEASAHTLLLAILDRIINDTADWLEQLASHIDSIGSRIFDFGTERQESRLALPHLEKLLKETGFVQFSLNKVRESLQTLSRVFIFLNSPIGGRHEIDLAPASDTVLKSLIQDTTSLTNQTDYLLQNVEFLLSSATGRISIEQNAVMKVLSVASLIFLPPTVIGSIYGMNFAHMPELTLPYAYPAALVAMLLAAILPLWFFRRKGWL